MKLWSRRLAQAGLLALVLTMVAAGVAAVGYSAQRNTLAGPQQQAMRVYSLHNLITFDGSNCASGWSTSNPGNHWQFRCVTDTSTDGSGAVWLYGPRYDVRDSGIMWRNDLFPSSGNVAVEIRFRYPRMRKPYGQDAFTLYDRTYHGERLDDQWGNLCSLSQNAGKTWVDPACSDSQVTGYSHGPGMNRNRIVGLDYDNRREWSEVYPTEWWTAVYHYDASSAQWNLAVDRGSATQWNRDGFAEPLGGPYDWQTSAVTGRGNPVSFKIGHHVHKISPAQPGEWNEAMVDYVAVWQWNEATPTPTATNTSTSTPTNTPTSTPTHTPTPTSTPTPTNTPTSTPTNTPTPTETPTPTPTPTPEPPVIDCDWRYLVWYGPNVPFENLPAQTLSGSAEPGAALRIRVVSPPDGAGAGCDATHTYRLTAYSTGYFQLGPTESGNPLFGTTCRGTWWARVTDLDHGLESDSVTWVVSWFPVHLGR